MTTGRQRNAGFTLLELLTVIAIISILLGMLVAALWKSKIATTANGAKIAVDEIVSAVEMYRVEFNALPPDTIPAHAAATGSQVLAWYLGQRFTIGESHPGPYLAPNKLQQNPATGLRELLTPFHRSYEYALLHNTDGSVRGYQVVDAGPDGLLGGTIDAEAGFVPDASDANNDGVPDHVDNVTGGELPH